jgi:hypothetical protein
MDLVSESGSTTQNNTNVTCDDNDPIVSNAGAKHNGTSTPINSTLNHTLSMPNASTSLVNNASTSTASSSSAASATAMVSLKVRFVDSNVTKTLQFNVSTLVFDMLKIIREKIPETSVTNGKTFVYFNTKKNLRYLFLFLFLSF